MYYHLQEFESTIDETLKKFPTEIIKKYLNNDINEFENEKTDSKKNSEKKNGSKKSIIPSITSKIYDEVNTVKNRNKFSLTRKVGFLHICMYICRYMYMYVSMCIMNLYTDICIYINVYTLVYLYVNIRICKHIFVYICVHNTSYIRINVIIYFIE